MHVGLDNDQILEEIYNVLGIDVIWKCKFNRFFGEKKQQYHLWIERL